MQIESAAATHGPVHAPLVYMPGSLEVAWSANVGVWQGGAGDEPEWAAGCAALRSQAGNLSRWLDWAGHRRRAAGAAGSAPTGLARAPPELSRWRSASGSRPRPAARVPIEPLVGHLRHPRFHCVGPERDTLELMFSTDYLVLPSEAELQLPAGARRLFFDLGASRYNQSCALGCQKWFVESFAAQGIFFDRILGWEAAEVDHAQMWRDVPGHLKPRMQYFNTPVSDDPASSDNPLNHLRALARPEDFVVFKLDIDTPTVEVSLIRQILGSPSAAGLIDELFWEHHVRRSPLVKTRVSLFGKSGIGWGEHLPSPTASDSTLADSFRLFRQLRECGIRAHSWI